MYRHVLCVFPYEHDLRLKLRLPPLGLEIIAAALAPFAREVEVIDMRFESGPCARFVRPDTDLVCVSVNWGYADASVAAQIRSLPAGVRVVVGGRHATEDPERWLTGCPNVDVVVRGDGEEAMIELARGTAPGEVAGISYRQDGRIVHTARRVSSPVIDGLRPVRATRRYSYHTSQAGLPLNLSVDSIATSRGCPFNCRFCSLVNNPWGSKRLWSVRSPEAVVEELAEIDATAVVVVDDNFAHDPDRVARICDLIVERGIKKRIVVETRVEIARHPDVIRKMELAGFSALFVGVESTQDRTLRAIGKGFDTAKVREYFEVLRHSTMLLGGFFIIGCIGETRDEMLTIASFAHELGIDVLSLMRLEWFRYTGLDQLVADSPGYHIDALGKVYSDAYTSRALNTIRRDVSRRFYTPSQMIRTLKKLSTNRLLTATDLALLPLWGLRRLLSRRRHRKAAADAGWQSRA
jgi:radical SAM superfamily enzyme YgiQ (UPF0313 family)